MVTIYAMDVRLVKQNLLQFFLFIIILTLTPSLTKPKRKMHRRAYKQCIFRSYNTSTFNAVRFDESSFTCQCEKEDKKAERFQVSHFYWPFASDIMAVKGLISHTAKVSPWGLYLAHRRPGQTMTWMSFNLILVSRLYTPVYTNQPPSEVNGLALKDISTAGVAPLPQPFVPRGHM